jgi:lysozyme
MRGESWRFPLNNYPDIVIDISHHNGNVDLAQAAASGIVAVLHKATQGVGYTDPKYAPNLAQAQANGLLWGAYHFGTGDDGVAQADAFLNFVQPTAQTLMALDIEANPQGASMTLEDARAFLVHVQSVTGRWPGVYGGYALKQMLGSQSDPTLQNCWFWLSQYGPTAVLPPNWASWALWQYTDGAINPNPVAVPGVGLCDRNYYSGTAADLQAKWQAGSL